MVWVLPPPVAVTVMVRVPLDALRLTVTVMVDEPAPVMLEGLNPTVTLEPSPEAEKLIEELKPPETETVITALFELPRGMLSEAGLALSEKSGLTPGTVSVTVVDELRLPEVPVTVIG